MDLRGLGWSSGGEPGGGSDHNEFGAYGELHMLRNVLEVSVPLTFTKTVITYNFIVGFQAIKFST